MHFSIYDINHYVINIMIIVFIIISSFLISVLQDAKIKNNLLDSLFSSISSEMVDFYMMCRI